MTRLNLGTPEKTERNRLIVEAVSSGRTLADISRELGITRERVRQIASRGRVLAPYVPKPVVTVGKREVWRDVSFFDWCPSWLYQVSNHGWVCATPWTGDHTSYGRVPRKLKGGRGWREDWMLPQSSKKGYWMVCLSYLGRAKSIGIHRLVMHAFVGPCPPGHVVNHRNSDPSDNRIENLEYVTHAENTRHAAQAGRMGRKKSSSIGAAA